ncbi:unnamed protein product [Schistosoma spindalis]|nr:unnamed protein product [Schistosoma spindale]
MQSSFYLYLSLYLFFIIIFITNIKTMNNSINEITFYIKEHPELNTLIGNLYQTNQLFNSSFVSSIQLETINFKWSKCFRIDRYSGNLYTTIDAKYLLDSEKICIKNKNSKIIFNQFYNNITQYCSINLIITINNRLLLSIIIQIEDINDNSPIFLYDDDHNNNNNTEIIYINETALPEYTKIPLKPAYDPDFNGYNKLYYYLTVIIDSEQNDQSLINSTNIHNPFRLHNDDDNDDNVITHLNESYHSTNLYLVLIKSLDYEIQSEYQYNLTVCDNQLNQLLMINLNIIHCTWKLIKIYINNINDELPWFQQTNYSVVIHENFLIGNEIIKITAIDNDSIPYNHIKYRIIPSHDMILLNNENLFHIDSNTGIIILNKSIKKPGIYRFLVEAYNNDYIYNNNNNNQNQYLSTIDHISLIRNYSTKHYKNIANVHIHIIDVNNHAPNIEIQQTQDTLIYYLNNNHTIQHINESKLIILKIPETLSINTPIAYFKITDEDELDNADITCHLIRSNYNDPFIYTYNNEKQYKLDIFQLIYVNRISDNTIINKLILSKNLDAENLSKHLLINKFKLNIDVESIAGYYGLLLNCHDNGIPQLTTSISIIIAIDDINEYYPNINIINTSLCNTWELKSSINHSYIYDININENIPIHSHIITLSVIDNDITSTIQFIQQITKLSIPFIIDKSNGIITNNDLIDYEYKNNYKMYIIIYDEKNLQKSFMTNILININIIDLNDNSPEFIISSLNDLQFDSNSFIEPIQNNIENIRIIEIEEEIIYTKPIGIIKALDRDTGKNAELIYFIAEISYQLDNTNKMININENQTIKIKQTLNTPKLLIDSNGALWCENKIDRELISIIDLIIGVHDLGEPKLTSYTKIRILIKDINDNNPLWQFPTETDFLVYVPKSLSIGKVITRIHAIDKDELTKNGHITYYILNPNNNNNNNSNNTKHKSKLDIISWNIITQFFILNSNSGELTVKHSLIQLPDGFLDIWLKAEDNGKVPRHSIAKLVLYLTTINSNINHNNHNDNFLNFDNPQKLMHYYEENKNTKDITIQIHSMGNLYDILPMKMDLNSNNVYLSTTPLYKYNIKTLSLLISGSIVGIIIIIIFLTLFIICFKYNSYYHHHNHNHNQNVKCNSITQINTIECSNNLSMKLSNSNYGKDNHCNDSNLNYETFTNLKPTTSTVKLLNNINNEQNQCNDQINEKLEKYNDLNRSSVTSLSINDTTIQTTYIPMNLMRNCNELHYSPITSVIDISDKIPIHLLHVSNDTFAVPLCMTHNITTSNTNDNNDYYHNHTTNEHTTNNNNDNEAELTTHPLTIVATVVSTDNIKQGLLPILTEQSNNNNNTVDITNNKLYENDTFIKLENLTHSDTYYTTYTPCLFNTTENTS